MLNSGVHIALELLCRSSSHTYEKCVRVVLLVEVKMKVLMENVKGFRTSRILFDITLVNPV